MSAAASAIVLPALPANSPITFRDDEILVGSIFGDNDHYRRYRAEPSFHRNPAQWYQFLARIDAHGRTWTACGGTYVTDDFGALVPVPRGLQ